MAKEHSLPYYLFITEGRRDWFMPSLRALAQSEIQTASSRIWTQIAYSISNDNNHYTKHTSSIFLFFFKLLFSK